MWPEVNTIITILMSIFLRKTALKGAAIIVLMWGAILCFGAQSVSDEFTDRRITAGTKIFRALLAADSEIVKKKSRSGELRLCLVYLHDLRNAQLSVDILHSRSNTDIKGIKISPEIVLFSDRKNNEFQECAGIFLTEQLPDEDLARLVALAERRGVVIFSPFEGDVERGVLGGIKVESRVLPYVNVLAMEESKIRLKSFFMKVAKTYEE